MNSTLRYSRRVRCAIRRTSLTQNAIDAGADWRCVTCGQRWDATRLSAVAAYAAWVVERAVIGPKEL
jgi:hypothetical protein